jgi:hypothetical protein
LSVGDFRMGSSPQSGKARADEPEADRIEADRARRQDNSVPKARIRTGTHIAVRSFGVMSGVAERYFGR